MDCLAKFLIKVFEVAAGVEPLNQKNPLHTGYKGSGQVGGGGG